MGTSFKWVQDRERLLLDKAQTMEYKEVADGGNLSIHFYFPKQFKSGPTRPVLLFFNDGGWDRGNVIQFAPQALYYVERGAVCGLVQYRNRSSHPDSTPLDSLQDGRSAIQFVRDHAEKLHIDTEKVISVGAGAGANIVAGVSLQINAPVRDPEYKREDSLPNATVLISAIVEVEKGAYGYEQFRESADCRQANLIRHAKRCAAPMLILHGTADRISAFERVSEFAATMKRKKSDCDFVEFEGRDHSFFNLNVDPVSYEASLTYIDRFLDRTGMLDKSSGGDQARIISRSEGDY